MPLPGALPVGAGNTEWHSGHTVFPRSSWMMDRCLHVLQRSTLPSRMMRPLATHTWQSGKKICETKTVCAQSFTTIHYTKPHTNDAFGVDLAMSFKVFRVVGANLCLGPPAS